jgi:acyl-CoA synthetase (NDP forming)
MDDEATDSVIFVTVVPTFLPRRELAEGLIHLLVEEGYQKKKPVCICIMAGNYVWECRQILERAGIHTFDTPAHCVKAMSHMTAYGQFLKEQEEEADE